MVIPIRPVQNVISAHEVGQRRAVNTSSGRLDLPKVANSTNSDGQRKAILNGWRASAIPIDPVVDVL